MERTLLLIGMLVLGAFRLWGQSYMVKGSIENAEKGQVYLAAYHGDRFSAVDSMFSASGDFYFLFDEASEPGLFRIIFTDRVDGIRSENRFIEFIFNRENVEVYIATGERGPVPYFDHTLENQVYNEFMAYELNYEGQVMLAYGQLPDPRLVLSYDSLQLDRMRFMDSLTFLFPDLYAIRMMNAFRSPLIPGALSHARRMDTLKSCFFDHAAIDDPLLLNAPVYTYKIIDYLSLFKVDTLTLEEQEAQFILAVDGIMANVSGDPSLRAFVVDFLLQGFELLGMEEVQVHLAENYLDENCESDVVELVLSRMKGYKAMSRGTVAPDFIIRDREGINQQLSLLDHEYVLVLFWASTCEHCQQLLPELKQWVQDEKKLDLEVVAISIDSSETHFELFTEALNPPWISAHDPLGWEGKAPSDYYVYATPTLYLLNRSRTLLARPTSFRQFLKAVKKLED